MRLITQLQALAPKAKNISVYGWRAGNNIRVLDAVCHATLRGIETAPKLELASWYFGVPRGFSSCDRDVTAETHRDRQHGQDTLAWVQYLLGEESPWKQSALPGMDTTDPQTVWRRNYFYWPDAASLDRRAVLNFLIASRQPSEYPVKFKMWLDYREAGFSAREADILSLFFVPAKNLVCFAPLVSGHSHLFHNHPIAYFWRFLLSQPHNSYFPKKTRTSFSQKARGIWGAADMFKGLNDCAVRDSRAKMNTVPPLPVGEAFSRLKATIPPIDPEVLEPSEDRNTGAHRVQRL